MGKSEAQPCEFQRNGRRRLSRDSLEKTGRRLTSDPIRTSLGLLPSGPDPVGEWLRHPPSPRAYFGPKAPGSQRGGGGAAAVLPKHPTPLMSLPALPPPLSFAAGPGAAPERSRGNYGPRGGRAGAVDDRDQSRRAISEGDYQVRQAEYRGARQSGAATAHPRDRAPFERRRLATSGLGRDAAARP